VQLSAGEHETLQSDAEMCAVVLSGAVDVTIAGAAFGTATRELDVFDGPGGAGYVPPGDALELGARRDAVVAVAAAPLADLPAGAARLIAPTEQAVRSAGTGNWSRSIRTILGPEDDAGRLLVGETINPPGNWSSYPPHKHEQERLPVENDLEEVYAYRFEAPEAFGVQRLYSRDGDLDETWTVRDLDVLLVPRGYHPFCAAHGYHGYYLNALAADTRSMAAEDDPDLAWTRDAWSGMERDPRVPITGKETA
jgi:5-deoxy-glucuronate isomerase